MTLQVVRQAGGYMGFNAVTYRRTLPSGAKSGSSTHAAPSSHAPLPLAAAWFALMALAAMTCSPALAQVTYGSIVGTVTDASGSGVPGASVRVTSLGTNETRPTVTGIGGTYSVPNLPPGQYRVEVQQSGFKQFVRRNVAVQVDVTSRVDVSLEIGELSQAVEVSGEAPLLQTDSASLGNVVSHQAIQSIR
jgi:hypothetical protein